MRFVAADQLTRAAGDGISALEKHCEYSARCQVAGVNVELRTDTAEVARLFALRYADQPATREPDFRYFVATVRGGYAFWCAHAPPWNWTRGPLPADAVAFLADAVALNALVRFDASLSAIQGAAVEFEGIAAAIIGASPALKTEAIFACARRGMHFYSDERVMLRSAIVYPFLRRNSVRSAGPRLLLNDLDADSLADPVRFAPDLSMRTCFGSGAIAQPAPLRALFEIAGASHCAALEPIETATALPGVARVFDARGELADRISHAIAVLRGVRCFRLTLGTSDESSAAIAYALTRLAHE